MDANPSSLSGGTSTTFTNLAGSTSTGFYKTANHLHYNIAVELDKVAPFLDQIAATAWNVTIQINGSQVFSQNLGSSSAGGPVYYTETASAQGDLFNISAPLNIQITYTGAVVQTFAFNDNSAVLRVTMQNFFYAPCCGSPTAGTLTANTLSGLPDTPVTITGSGWVNAPNSIYQLLFNGMVVDTQTGLACSTQPNMTFPVPCLKFGSYQIVNQMVDNTGKVLFSSQPLSFTIPKSNFPIASAGSTCASPITVSSLTVSMASTQNPADKKATPIPPGTIDITNTSTQFADANSPDLVVVFQGTSDLAKPTVTANGIDKSKAHLLNWVVMRDRTDTVGNVNTLPALSKQSGDQITITPSTAGNFIVICYNDINNNNAYDPGEELRVLRLAIVRVTTQGTPIIFTDKPPFTYIPIFDINNPQNEVETGNDSIGQFAMRISINVLLEGGGANRLIGVNKVNIGDVGNLGTTSNTSADTAQVNYPVPAPTPPPPGNVTGIETENTGGPIPMLDTLNVAVNQQATGSDTAFRNNSSLITSDGPGGIGQIFTITSLDAPALGPWNTFHPITKNIWETTQGGYDFREFIVAYSKSFDRYYVVIAKGDWSVMYNGQRASTTGNWINTGSTITIQGMNILRAPLTITVTNNSPQPGNDAEVQVLGFSLAQQAMPNYSTLKK